MVVAVAELHLQLDAAEERRRRVEDEAVRTGLEIVGEPGSAVSVGVGRGDLLRAAMELDGDVWGGFPRGSIEDVRRERSHGRNLRA